MTALIVILMFVAFVAVDYAVRESTRRMREKKERQAREAVLNTSIRLDFTHEAKSLKRVEVPNPKARVLAVDAEAVILDSFRRILVLEGFSVDTVETGPEALGLIQRHDYDFVFTDLKMPVMDGVEVVKAVKHLRPDIDVVVITGYGSIDTAVETLQHGASEYVQKPFTVDELSEFARKLLIKREARLEIQRKPVVRVVSPYMAEATPPHEYCVPGGAFLSPNHVWARIEPNGQVRIGIDDFIRKALGPISKVEPLEAGQTVKQGDTLVTLTAGKATLHLHAPLGGKVVKDNPDLKDEPGLIKDSPYDRGWICLLHPSDLAGELSSLRIGKPLVAWYQEEVERFRKSVPAEGPQPESPDFAAFEKQFLEPTKG